MEIFSLKIRKDKVKETINTAGGIGIFFAIMTVVSYFLFNPVFDEFSFAITLITGILIALLSMLVFLKSRIASILLLVLFTLDRIGGIVIYTVQQNIGAFVSTIFIGAVFFMALLRGAKATIIHHKHIKK
ncbi:MAG: hypothetical protein KJ601_08050 [Nanoarchaeota archaeon]|nr:hypothetical protein [Nanoarchaeota archaeon]